MYPPVATRDPAAVELEVQAAYLAMFTEADRLFVPRVFGWAIECFTGGYRSYQAVDAQYHDFEHTLQGTLCLSRLLLGRYRAGEQPVIERHLFELGLVAILLHDTGYLKKRGDTQGTGAKYTATHVDRSAHFAAELMTEKGFHPKHVLTVQNMIQCTGVNTHTDTIPFQTEAERILGFALGTADFLGQMAAVDYVDKLPVLFEEFAEAKAYTGDQRSFIASFASAEDLMQKTPYFWEKIVRPKLDGEFRGLYRFLEDPLGSGENEYLIRIAANLARLKG
jgi:hypothetical protein